MTDERRGEEAERPRTDGGGFVDGEAKGPYGSGTESPGNTGEGAPSEGERDA